MQRALEVLLGKQAVEQLEDDYLAECGKGIKAAYEAWTLTEGPQELASLKQVLEGIRADGKFAMSESCVRETLRVILGIPYELACLRASEVQDALQDCASRIKDLTSGVFSLVPLIIAIGLALFFVHDQLEKPTTAQTAAATRLKAAQAAESRQLFVVGSPTEFSGTFSRQPKAVRGEKKVKQEREAAEQEVRKAAADAASQRRNQLMVLFDAFAAIFVATLLLGASLLNITVRFAWEGATLHEKRLLVKAMTEIVGLKARFLQAAIALMMFAAAMLGYAMMTARLLT